jgi:hypothetical protein
MKKIYKVIIIVLILFVLIIGISQILNQKEQGWSVKYNSNSLELSKNKCRLQGGRWLSPGLSDLIYCDFILSDAGKECNDSDQCKGSCVIEVEAAQSYCPDYNMYTFTLPCDIAKGACSKYIIRSCSGYTTIQDGILSGYYGPCD